MGHALGCLFMPPLATEGDIMNWVPASWLSVLLCVKENFVLWECPRLKKVLQCCNAGTRKVPISGEEISQIFLTTLKTFERAILVIFRQQLPLPPDFTLLSIGAFIKDYFLPVTACGTRKVGNFQGGNWSIWCCYQEGRTTKNSASKKQITFLSRGPWWVKGPRGGCPERVRGPGLS